MIFRRYRTGGMVAGALCCALFSAGCISSTVRFSTPAPEPEIQKVPVPSKPQPKVEKPKPSVDDGDFGALLDDPVEHIAQQQTDDARLERIVDSWLGTPYRYGRMSKRGTDCSGLVFQIFREFAGIELPRSSEDMQRIGTRVPVTQMKPGDLVFFHNGSKRVDHVGIYLGQDEFVHASSKAGVVKNNMKEKYYRLHFIEARRILP